MPEAIYRETVLKVEKVNVSYDDNAILKDFSAEIKDVVGHGQVVGLLGPSGIGKSTLLRVLAGLETPNSGEVNVFHEGDKKLVPVERGAIGVVGQKYPLFRHRTVLGNLMIAAKMRKHSEEENLDRCMKYLQRFGIENLKSQYPIQISGGQRQRVAIIQQLLRSEHFILMDEPFTGLDLIMKNEACRLITEVAESNELNTIIVVTHGIPEALCVSDTLWLMGRDRDEKNNPIPGAFIKKSINLDDSGLAWNKEKTCHKNYNTIMQEIEKEFYTL